MIDRTSKNQKIPDNLIKYKPKIDRALSKLTERNNDELGNMIKYHLGYSDDGPGQLAGKAIRPSLCLFTAEALGGEVDDALAAACSLELIHNYSLVHDDIQDDDDMRRGMKTVKAIWGDNQAINAGDGLKDLSVLALFEVPPRGNNKLMIESIKILSEIGRAHV